MSFAEQYRDPRWQRKRLEVMEKAKFACQYCGDAESTLNVHHKFYTPDCQVWEYENHALLCLCESCHEDFHDRLWGLKHGFGYLWPDSQEYIVGFVFGRVSVTKGFTLGKDPDKDKTQEWKDGFKAGRRKR